MSRVLLLATTTGYQTRSFGEAAERLGVELVFATDRCHVIDDPWRDRAVPIRFYDEDGSVAAIVESAGSRPLDGILSLGDRPTVIGARVAQVLGLPGHPVEAAAIARNKRRTRERLRSAGLPTPWYLETTIAADPHTFSSDLKYPAVVKPVALSGSRGVMRVDNPASFVERFERLRQLLQSSEIRAERSDDHSAVLIEGFIPGREYALEGLLHHGVFYVLALFDKPDPLDGPFFEETIYLTPAAAPPPEQAAIVDAIAAAAKAIGLAHGPVHAECRVNADGIVVLEVAARPIGGLCARALRFERGGDARSTCSLEELLLRHALGESPEPWAREPGASGVMMIPIPQRGLFRRAEHVEEARSVHGIDDVRVTAKADQLLVPLPEGASYLGFIFSRAAQPAAVEAALRDAHSRLRFVIDPEIPVLARG
jgi:ATP-grasp domain-containing protein/L-aminoacid ligase-like protein